MTTSSLLRRAAERAAGDPFYLASPLLAYARAERLDDAALAQRLGCAASSLPALLLCRRPTGEGAVFRNDVQTIAARFDLDARRLAQVLRAADALVSLGTGDADSRGGLLAAARDHDHDGQPNAADAPARDRPDRVTDADEDAP